MIKTRLLFITWTHSGGGGAEKVLTTLVNNLDAEKYEIAIQEVMGFKVKREPINKNIRFLPPLMDGEDESRIDKQFTQYCLEAVPALIRSVRDLDDYDVIITWNYQLPSFMLPSFPDKKTVAWFHGAIDNLSPDEDFAESPSVIKLKNALQKKRGVLPIKLLRFLINP